MSYEDERIVKLSFDNEAFKKGVSDTLVALKNLEKALDIDPKTAARSFNSLTQSVDTTERAMTSLEGGMEKVKIGFSMLEVAGITAFASLTTAAISFGKNLYRNTLGQIQAGGFSRALNLENAKFQIEGLKESWSELKDDIQYGVQDTAYGLDEAAKVASQLVASNIKAGDEMKQSLRAISGVAAMTNSSYADIGQLFTTMAAQGRVMGHELTRLSYRGLNAAAAIAKYNKEIGNSALDTEKKVRDMASKGQISYKQFAEAMDQTFGAHAKEANKTFSGAMSNMRAALSRLGEAFQSPMLEFRRKFAVNVIPVINMLTKKMNELAVPGFKKILDLISNWTEKLFKSYSFMKFIYNVVMGIYSWIHEIIRALWQLGLIAPEAKDVAHSLAEMTNWMVLNGERAEKFRNVIKFLVKGLQVLLTVVDAIIYVLEPIYKPILDFLKKTIDSVATATGETGDLFTKIIDIIKIVAVIMRMGLERFLVGLKKTIIFIVNVLKILSIVLQGVLVLLALGVAALFEFAKAAYTYAKNAILSITWLKDAFIALYDTIKEVFTKAGEGISNFINNLTTSTGTLWDKISNLFQDKTMKATVVVDAVVPNLTGDSIIQNDAVNGVNSATKSLGNYSSAAKEAEKAGKKANKATSGGSGAKFSGYFGVNTGIKDAINRAIDPTTKDDDPEKKVRDIADAVTKTSDQFGESVKKIDSATKNSDVFGSGNNFGENLVKQINSIKEATEKLEKVAPFWKGLIVFIISGGSVLVTVIETLFSGLIDVFVKGSNSIPVLFENLADGLINGFRKLLYSIPESLAKFGEAIKENAGSIDQILEIIKSIKWMLVLMAVLGKFSFPSPKVFEAMALVLLAFGAVIVSIGIVSNFINKEAFEAIAKFVAIFSALAIGMMAIISILTLANAISTLVQKLSKLLSVNITKSVVDISGAMQSMALIMSSMTISIMAMMAIVRYMDDGDFTNLIVVTSIMVTAVSIIIGNIIALIKICGSSGAVTTSTTFKFLRAERNMTAPLAGIIGLISTLTPLITTLGVMVAVLSTRDIDTITRIFSMFMGSFLVMMISISGLIVYMNESMLKRGNFWTRDDKAAFKLNSILKSISLNIISIEKFMTSLAGIAMLLSFIDTDKVSGISTMMATIVGVMVVAIAGYITAMTVLQKMMSKGVTGPGLGKLIATMTGILAGISAFITVLSVSLRILAGADPGALTGAAVKLGAIMVVLVGTVSVLVGVAKTMQSLDPTKAAAMSVTFKNMAGIMGMIVGSVVTIAFALVVMAKAIDSINNPASLVWSVSILSGIFVAIGAFYVIINKTASLMPSMQTVYGVVLLSGAMVTMILAIAVLMKVISTIDVDAKLVLTTIGAILVAFTSIFLLSKFISGGVLTAIAAGWKGLVVIAAFIAAIAGLIALIGYTIGYVGENITKLAVALNDLTRVNWQGLANTTASMKDCMSNLVETLSQTLNLKNVAGIAILSAGLYLLANAVKGLSELQPEQLTAFAVAVKMVLQTFSDNAAGVAIAAIIATFFVHIGWSLAAGMVGFMIFVALVPLLCKGLGAALNAISKVTEIQIDLEKTFAYFKEMLPLAGILLVVGGLILAGGIGLAIGGAGLYLGILAISAACDLVEEDSKNLKDLSKYVKDLIGLGFVSVLAGWLLSSGAGMLAIGSVLMIAAVGIMKGVYKIIKTDFKKLDMAIGYVGGLILLGIVSAVAGLTLIIGAGMLSIGSMLFLASCGGFALSLLVLNKAFEVVDFNNILNSMGDVVRLCNMLGEIGVVLWLTMPTFIIGTALLGIAMLGFAVAGVEIAIGAVGLVIGIMALYKAFEIIDMDYINENTNKLIEFGKTISEVGKALQDGILPFTIAAVLFVTAAISIGVGIIVAAGSILIASMAFNETMYVLDGAFDQMLLTFSKVSLMDIFGVVGVLGVLGVGVLVTGLLLSMGAIPFLIGSVVILLASLSLSEAMDRLSKALEMKKVLKLLASLAVLSVGFIILTAIAPILLMGGLMFIMFSEMLYQAADKIEQASIKLKNAGDNIHEFSEQTSEDGKNALYGFIGGLADKTGMSDLKDVATAIPQMVLDTIDDVLEIHSPSRAMFDRALNATSSFINTLSDGTGDKIADAVRPWGYAICDVLDGFQNPIASIAEACGIDASNGWINGLSQMFGLTEDVLGSFKDQFGGALNGILNEGNDALIAQYRVNAQGIRYKADQERKKGELTDNQMGERYAEAAEWDRMADELEKQKNIFDVDTPKFEMPEVSASSPVSPDTSGALASMGDVGTTKGTSNLAKSAGGNAGTAVTNNTYNFVQNNYSPEPIDRTELYTQTQNQLDSWYKFVRDNG